MALMANVNTIVLKGHSLHNLEEARVAPNLNNIIYGGMAIDLNSAGDVIPFNTAGGNTVLRVPIEPALNGRTLLDPYTNPAVVSGVTYYGGMWVRYVMPGSGDLVNLLCAHGTINSIAQTYAIGDRIIFGAGGLFNKIGTTANPLRIVAQAEEAFDLSGLSGPAYIRARII